jgi:quercetin dioxygenase-like cupin family protein
MNNPMAFENGEVHVAGRQVRVADLAWNPHATFAGVALKHLIKGEQTQGRLSCHLVRIDSNAMIGDHIHEGKAELHEVIAGQGMAEVGAQKIPYFPGVQAWVPDNVSHRIEATGDSPLYLLAKFTPALL